MVMWGWCCAIIAMYLSEYPISLANRRKLLMGSEPVERMNTSGVMLDMSSNKVLRSTGGLSTNDLPRFSETKSMTANTTWRWGRGEGEAVRRGGGGGERVGRKEEEEEEEEEKQVTEERKGWFKFQVYHTIIVALQEVPVHYYIYLFFLEGFDHD